MSALDYFTAVQGLIEKIRETQLEKIKKAGKLFARKIQEDRIIHIVGTGHSHMIGEELFARAGGIPHINALLDVNLILTPGARKNSKLEKLPGLAEIIWEEYKIESEDIFVIVSNSGRNNIPVEMALKAREEGIYLITITSMDHTKKCTSRHNSGKKVYELADLVFDNCVPRGDCLLKFNGVKAVAGSTVGGVVIVNSIIGEALDILSQRGVPLPVYTSQNVDGADNEGLFTRYKDRIKHL